MKVPREIDELMWEVADNRSEALVEQFGSRYPEFVGELEKRIQMVADLKGSRPTRSLPAFEPRSEIRNLGPSRLAVASIAALVLCSVTFAAYALVQFNQSRHIDEPMTRPELIFTPPDFVEEPSAPEGSVEPVEPNLGTADPPVRPIETHDPYLTAVSIESEEISLQAAIVQIAEQAGLHANVLPGFEDLKIRISYKDQPALGIIQALGKQFGFTAVRDATVDILIVPTRTGAPLTDPNTRGDAGPAKMSRNSDSSSTDDGTQRR